MDRRRFATVAALPLIQLQPCHPTDGVQELILPNHLAYVLERHCSLPLEERFVRADEAAKIGEEINIKTGAVFRHRHGHVCRRLEAGLLRLVTGFYTGKRWKQLAIAEQIAKAGEFSVIKRDHLFVLRTSKCKLPSFRTSDRRLIVDYDHEWGWAGLGGGWPSFIHGNELHFMRADWFILAIDVFGLSNKPEFFEDDVLLADITKQLADRLMQQDIDPEPWPGMGFGWQEIAGWLSEGECLFVPFPKQPMI